MIRNEMKRAIGSINFKLAMSVGMIIMLLHFLQAGIPMYRVWSSVVKKTTDPMLLSKIQYIDTPLEIWLMIRINRFQYLYMYLLPLLTVLPHGASYISDCISGYANQILSRTSRRQYIFAKMCATFVSGGCVAVIPSLCNLVLCMCVLPWGTPVSSTKLYSVLPNSLFSHIFYSNPIIYVALATIVQFVFWGFFACTALTFSLLEEKTYMVLVTPFIVNFIVTTFASKLFSLGTYMITQFMYLPQFYMDRVGGIAIVFGVIAVLNLMFVLFGGKETV